MLSKFKTQIKMKEEQEEDIRPVTLADISPEKMLLLPKLKSAISGDFRLSLIECFNLMEGYKHEIYKGDVVKLTEAIIEDIKVYCQLKKESFVDMNYPVYGKIIVYLPEKYQSDIIYGEGEGEQEVEEGEGEGQDQTLESGEGGFEGSGGSKADGNGDSEGSSGESESEYSVDDDAKISQESGYDGFQVKDAGKFDGWAISIQTEEELKLFNSLMAKQGYRFCDGFGWKELSKDATFALVWCGEDRVAFHSKVGIPPNYTNEEKFSQSNWKIIINKDSFLRGGKVVYAEHDVKTKGPIQ